MKKLFTLGLLAFAINASAAPKSVETLKNTTKIKQSKKSLFDCQTGMTSCGYGYSSCANYDQDPLEVYDQMEALAC